MIAAIGPNLGILERPLDGLVTMSAGERGVIYTFNFAHLGHGSCFASEVLGAATCASAGEKTLTLEPLRDLEPFCSQLLKYWAKLIALGVGLILSQGLDFLPWR